MNKQKVKQMFLKYPKTLLDCNPITELLVKCFNLQNHKEAISKISERTNLGVYYCNNTPYLDVPWMGNRLINMLTKKSLNEFLSGLVVRN